MLLLLREPAPERNRVWSGDELNSSLYLFVALYYSFFSYTRDNISPLENEPYHLLSRFLTIGSHRPGYELKFNDVICMLLHCIVLKGARSTFIVCRICLPTRVHVVYWFQVSLV